MALEILEKDNFKLVKTILNDDTIEDSSLMKRGLKKAVEDLAIDLQS